LASRVPDKRLDDDPLDLIQADVIATTIAAVLETFGDPRRLEIMIAELDFYAGR
jgi:hypothetical protein